MYTDLLIQLRDRLAALKEAAEGESSDDLKKTIATVVTQLDDAIKHIGQEISTQESVSRELQRTTSIPLPSQDFQNPHDIRCEN